MDCAYLATAAADFVMANWERFGGIVKVRKSASDFASRAWASDAASAYAGRPVAGMMR